MNISIIRLSESAILPTRGSNGAAGYDLYADIPDIHYIDSGCCSLIPTSIAVAIPKGYYGALQSRSGLATKRHLRVAQGTGIIDEDYRGQIMVPLYNDDSVTAFIHPGERIAQLIIQRYEPIDFIEVDNLDETDRGTGGFGSTGTI